MIGEYSAFCECPCSCWKRYEVGAFDCGCRCLVPDRLGIPDYQPCGCRRPTGAAELELVDEGAVWYCACHWCELRRFVRQPQFFTA